MERLICGFKEVKEEVGPLKEVKIFVIRSKNTYAREQPLYLAVRRNVRAIELKKRVQGALKLSPKIALVLILRGRALKEDELLPGTSVHNSTLIISFTQYILILANIILL